MYIFDVMLHGGSLFDKLCTNITRNMHRLMNPFDMFLQHIKCFEFLIASLARKHSFFAFTETVTMLLFHVFSHLFSLQESEVSFTAWLWTLVLLVVRTVVRLQMLDQRVLEEEPSLALVALLLLVHHDVRVGVPAHQVLQHA